MKSKGKTKRGRMILSIISVLFLAASIMIYVFSDDLAWLNMNSIGAFSSEKRPMRGIQIVIKDISPEYSKESMKSRKEFLNRFAEIVTCSVIVILLAWSILKCLDRMTTRHTQAAHQLRRKKHEYWG